MFAKTAWIVPAALALVTCMLLGVTGIPLLIPVAGLFIIAAVYVLWRDFRPKGARRAAKPGSRRLP